MPLTLRYNIGPYNENQSHEDWSGTKPEILRTNILYAIDTVECNISIMNRSLSESLGDSLKVLPKPLLCAALSTDALSIYKTLHISETTDVFKELLTFLNF